MTNWDVSRDSLPNFDVLDLILVADKTDAFIVKKTTLQAFKTWLESALELSSGATVQSETFEAVAASQILELTCQAVLNVYEIENSFGGTVLNDILTDQYSSETFYSDASSNDGDAKPWRAYDGNVSDTPSTSEGWRGYASDPCWISGEWTTPKTIGGVKIAVNQSSIDNGFLSETYTIKYSSNNTDWTTIYTATSVSDWVAGEYKTFPFSEPATAGYWRIYLSDHLGGQTAIDEIQWLGTLSSTSELVNRTKDYRISKASPTSQAHEIKKLTGATRDVFVQFI